MTVGKRMQRMQSRVGDGWRDGTLEDCGRGDGSTEWEREKEEEGKSENQEQVVSWGSGTSGWSGQRA